MKITTTYTCEVCGFCSDDKEEVQRCEAQGRTNKFSQGEEVEFRYRYRPRPFDSEEIEEQWVKAKIERVSFSEKTHKVRYAIGPTRKDDYTAPWNIVGLLRCTFRWTGEDELRAISTGNGLTGTVPKAGQSPNS